MVSFDYVVLGSGVAGLTFALEAAAHGRVAVVCKAAISETNTLFAQGGIAAVLAAADSFEQHVQDTLLAGAGLCNEAAVRFMVGRAPESINWLQEQGVAFDTDKKKSIALGLEGGHSQHRIVHVKDHTGLRLQQVQGQAARQHPNITILEHHMALELLLQHGSCHGVQLLDLKTGEPKAILARAVVLATGGSGQVYQHTTNPKIATGDGLAMAYRAGAQVSHMEFFQFHPTALYNPASEDTFLISEALRGAGAELVLPDGSRFMRRYHLQGSLAPRDVVARAVYHEMQHHHSPCLYLDARHLPEEHLQQHFPLIYNKCISIGIDAAIDFIPVVPAAHYQCGGVATNLHGQTSVPGLYAVGEVACTGVHGANRLASNSLLEGVVFGKAAAAHVVAQKYELPESMEVPEIPAGQASPDVSGLKAALRQLMWEKVGIERTHSWLEQAQEQVRLLRLQLQKYALALSGEVWELRNLLTVAALTIEACLARKNSVGGHFLLQEAELVQA
ncbi:L-aspartate oxidase [Pontibacter chinhatensis]|uniref:L-aspartate oxidase n=1 Tax=Pontibacter chinhatensis TaxID=1436961 RepID=A0A1I2RZS3_9BACT|nr:L-aspartate oxidase [Pontibacter chinhatensis]SFG46124.1 L-aspartate oxidase [Pontibacter chinhatensis]